MNPIRRTTQDLARRRALADAATDGLSVLRPRPLRARFTPLERLRRRALADIASGFDTEVH